MFVNYFRSAVEMDALLEKFREKKRTASLFQKISERVAGVDGSVQLARISGPQERCSRGGWGAMGYAHYPCFNSCSWKVI